ncbi:MAG: NTP transferase domain-containing protein, partial [Staphylococcus sp.]|nr:NTP transferase domain-containing protein [Staphylococcus sp.]
MNCKSSRDEFIGVILAAGVGSRLRPMTNTKPKCLVKTSGKPILQYQIDAYRKAGVKELIIVVGYESLSVKQFCKHIKDLKITIVENNDYENTNNMYSFYLTKDYLTNRPFILNNADLSIDLSIVERLIDFNKPSAVVVDSSQFNHESMKISLNEKKLICDISKDIPQRLSSGCSIDFYK